METVEDNCSTLLDCDLAFDAIASVEPPPAIIYSNLSVSSTDFSILCTKSDASRSEDIIRLRIGSTSLRLCE